MSSVSCRSIAIERNCVSNDAISRCSKSQLLTELVSTFQVLLVADDWVRPESNLHSSELENPIENSFDD